MRARRWLGPALRLGATVAVLALVLRLMGAQAVGAALRGADPGWLMLAVAALAAQIALSAARWRLTAGALGLAVPAGLALREYWLSVLGNSVLPGGVLGDVGRALRLRHRGGLARMAETVVIERLAGQLALFAAAGLGAVVWAWPHPGACAGAGLAALAVSGGVLAIRRAGQGTAQGRMVRLLRLLHAAWAAPGVWRGQLGLSAAILACNIGGVWAAARAVGVALDPGAALMVIPLTLAAMLVPLTVAGWGLREGAAAALWPLAGVAAPQAVAASVLFGLAALMAALPGVLALRTSGAPQADVIGGGHKGG